MKKFLSIIMLLGTLLSLTACRQDKEPPEITDTGESQGQSPFADANTTDRYYLSTNGIANGLVYGDDFYYSSSRCSIVATPLSEAVKHNILTEQSVKRVNEYITLCPDPMCKHDDLSCPTMMRDPFAQFLIDAAESNGGPAVIYYYRATSETWEEDGSITVHGSEIVRFDVAEGEAKQVIFSDKPIKQLMSYGDYLYFTTQTSDDRYKFNAVKKTGDGMNTLSPGDGYLRLIGANKQGVYVNDDQGNVYAIDHQGENYELIYTVPEVYPLHASRPAELNMFVEGDYLYFFADFEIGYVHGDWDMIKHSVRRVRLDQPSGEGEMVAESVFETSVYGVYNGVLYYGPFDVRTDLEGPEYSDENYYSKGTIKAVDLKTLETTEIVTDCGFDFYDPMPNSFYINDRCIIGVNFNYKKFGSFNTSDGVNYCSLYSFEDGALYCVTGGAIN